WIERQTPDLKASGSNPDGRTTAFSSEASTARPMGSARARASLARSLHVGTASASAQSISCHSGSCRPARGVRFRQHALGAQRSFQPDADGGSPGDRRDAAPAGDARTRKHPDPGGHSVHDVHARCRRGLHARYVSDSFGYPDGGLDVPPPPATPFTGAPTPTVLSTPTPLPSFPPTPTFPPTPALPLTPTLPPTPTLF